MKQRISSARVWVVGVIATALVLVGAAAVAVANGLSADVAPSSSAGAAQEVKPPSGFSSHHERVNGFRMHYVRGGKGSPVVLLHGFPQTWSEWRPQMEELAKDHTVIAVDLRGAGDSGVPKKGYDTVQLAEDVHSLLTQLGLDRGIQIVAHDIGLWVAYPYAAMWPSEVDRMAVMEGPIPDQRIYDYPALNPGGQPSIWHFGFFQEELSERLVAGHERELVEGFITQFLGVKNTFTGKDFEFYAGYLREPGRWKAWMEMYRALDTDVAQNEKLKAQGPLTMPILAIGGEKSLGASIGEQWKEYASNVDARILPDAGHWVTEENPRALNAMLRGFLK
jgi:pimeloyl-ACP methyl ester carboxylesterase